MESTSPMLSTEESASISPLANSGKVILLTDFGTDHVEHDIQEYGKYFSDDTESVDARKKDYETMVNHYYDLVTSFFEYGWGDSFHFAPRYKGEPFDASIRRYEHLMATKVQARRDELFLDVGCGVGGPLREISQFSGAKVIGLNNNEYQVGRAEQKTIAAGLGKRCSFVKGDFMKIPFPENAFSGAYAFEATCHAPDKVGCFGEVLRVTKSGGFFATAEWEMTEKYDADNAEHRKVKLGIETGDGLPSMPIVGDIAESMRVAGWEVVEAIDLAEGQEVPWYAPLAGDGWGLSDLLKGPSGRWLTSRFVSVLEALRVAPKGTVLVNSVLNNAAENLVLGGKMGIFTPLFLVVGRKP